MQAAAEREAKETNLNEFPENDDSIEAIEETVDDTFHVNNRLEDDMDHQVLVPVTDVTDEFIEEEIVDSSFMVQTTQ